MKRASNYDDDEHDGNNDHNDQSMPVMETEPPEKRFKHLSRVSIILEEKESNEDSRAGVNLTAEDLEKENYSKYKPSRDDLCSEPFSFWINQKLFFPTWHLLLVIFLQHQHPQQQLKECSQWLVKHRKEQGIDLVIIIWREKYSCIKTKSICKIDLFALFG